MLKAAVGVVTASALLWGCAGSQVHISDPKEALTKTVAARWEALVAGHVGQSYDEYVSPASKQAMSRDVYIGSIKPGAWRSAKVAEINCPEPDVCNVVVDVGYAVKPKYGQVFENVRRVDEVWRFVDGRWWIVLDR